MNQERLAADFRLFARDKGISSMQLDGYANTACGGFAGAHGEGYINPTIIEERRLNVATMDVFSRLMMDRIIFLGCGIDDTVANIVQGQLLYLASVDPNAPISIYVNSPGGSVSAGLGIYDTMQLVEPQVKTICTGMAASMGAVLLAAGSERSILPHARVMIHQPLGGAQGQASDILIAAKEIELCRRELVNILSEHTGQPAERLMADMDRDCWMSSSEALSYGIVDKILESKKRKA